MQLRYGILVCCLFASTFTLAQRGTAPSGNYPVGYHGDIFRGKLTAVDAKTDTLTLMYEKGNKQESFDGRLDKPCDIPNSGNQPVRASDFPLGTDLTAYFVSDKDPATGQKQHVIIGVTLNSYNGKEIPERSRGFFLCNGTRSR